jgi:hypothetical protein
VVFEIKEIPIDAGSNQEINFIVTAINSGSYAVDVNGLNGSFAVREVLPPEFIVFDITPFYDASLQLAFIRVTYEIDNVYPLVTDINITLRVLLEGALFEEVSLVPSNELQSHGIKGTIDYTPTNEWQQGHYSFITELYYGDHVSAASDEKDVKGDLLDSPAVISWGLLSGIIGGAFLISMATIVILFIRQRRLSRSLWLYRVDAVKLFSNREATRK